MKRFLLLLLAMITALGLTEMMVRYLIHFP